MAWTRHGHHISGSTIITYDPARPHISRCGGSTICRQCWSDEKAWQNKYSKENDIVADNILGIPFSSSDEGDDKIERAKLAVVQDFSENTAANPITIDQVYVVKFGYILGNWKAFLSTTVPDGKYYEVTYSDLKGETYVDTYIKIRHAIIPDKI